MRQTAGPRPDKRAAVDDTITSQPDQKLVRRSQEEVTATGKKKRKRKRRRRRRRRREDDDDDDSGYNTPTDGAGCDYLPMEPCQPRPQPEPVPLQAQPARQWVPQPPPAYAPQRTPTPQPEQQRPHHMTPRAPQAQQQHQQQQPQQGRPQTPPRQGQQQQRSEIASPQQQQQQQHRPPTPTMTFVRTQGPVPANLVQLPIERLQETRALGHPIYYFPTEGDTTGRVDPARLFYPAPPDTSSDDSSHQAPVRARRESTRERQQASRDKKANEGRDFTYMKGKSGALKEVFRKYFPPKGAAGTKEIDLAAAARAPPAAEPAKREWRKLTWRYTPVWNRQPHE